MADVFCDTEVPPYVQKECGIERAGIVAVALMTIDQNPTDANLSSKTWWETVLASSPATHHIIRQTRGELPPATAIEEEGFGRESTQVTGADRTATLEVEGLLDNRDFWESVNLKKWFVCFVTNGDLLYFVSTPVTVFARINNPRNIRGGAFWAIDFKWQDYSIERVVEIPADIFDDDFS